MPISRRQFVTSVGAGALALRSAAQAGSEQKLPARPLGKTGWRASIYALGTAEIPETEEAVRAMHKLLEGGVNYIDTAPSYQGTRSESAIGQVMKTRRKGVFLATKTLARDSAGAYREVTESMKRLQTDRIDLLQIHAVNDFGTLDAVLRKGGAVEGLERAKREGLIRFVGITGHTRPEVIVRALDEYPFDSILVPVSALDKHLFDFAESAIPKANKLGVAVVGMKALKGIERSGQRPFDATRFLRYAWSLPISTLTIGLRREFEAGENLATARSFVPMSAREKLELEGQVRGLANDSTLWWKRR